MGEVEMENEFWLLMKDGTEIYVKKWYNQGRKPKAIVQLAHGMVEHINRYREFAEFLVGNDIFVYGNDHRGHGKTGQKQGLMGFLAEEKGFEKTTNDLYRVTKHIQEDYPDVPLFVFGHSMGSFLARNYIQKHSNTIEGAILSGTGYYSRLTIKSGRMLASLLPPREESCFMDYLAFGSNNKKVDNKKTDFDWLSNDENLVKEYVNDPQTGFIPTARFFYDLMCGLGFIHNQKRNKSIRRDLPMLLISGDADPVGDYAKGVWKTARLYEDAGLESVTTMLFEDGRHELLNELKKEEVYEAIHTWVEKRLARAADS